MLMNKSKVFLVVSTVAMLGAAAGMAQQAVTPPTPSPPTLQQEQAALKQVCDAARYANRMGTDALCTFFEEQQAKVHSELDQLRRDNAKLKADLEKVKPTPPEIK